MIEFENDTNENKVSKAAPKKVKAEEVKPVEVPAVKPVVAEAKPVAKPVPAKAAKVSKYEQWQKDHGSELIRKGLGQRNILLKAAKVSGAGFDEVMLILGQNITLREKLVKIFKE